MAPFIDQIHSYIVVFSIIAFRIYNILVKTWKHVIGPNYIISFYEELEIILTSIIEIFNIYKYSHEEAIVIFHNK